jgi:hypothetical protein
MSLLSVAEKLYVAGRFQDGFGVSGATNVMVLTRTVANDMSKITVQPLGNKSLPPDCKSVSHIQAGTILVNNAPTLQNLVAVCNVPTLVLNTSPQLYRNKSKIIKLDLKVPDAAWFAIGGDLDSGKDESYEMSVIEAFDVAAGVAVAAVRSFPTESDSTRKSQLRRLDLTSGVWSDVTSPEADVKFSIKLNGPNQLFVGGRLGNDGNGIIQVIPLGSQPLSGGSTLPPAATLLSTGSSLPVTSLNLDFIPSPAGQTTGGETRLIVGSPDDLRVYTMRQELNNQVTVTLMSPVAGEKPISGDKSLVAVNYSDSTRVVGKLGSYFVVGSFPTDQSPGCSQVEAWMPKSQVTLNDFGSGNIQLAVNHLVHKGQDLKALFDAATQDVIPLIKVKVNDLPPLANAAGRSLSMQAPTGCVFKQNGQEFMNWNLDFAQFYKIEPTQAISERICIVKTPFKPEDPTGSLAIVCGNSTASPPANSSTSPTGAVGKNQWPITETEAMSYGDEFFGQSRGNSYSRRESLKFTRSDFAHTIEYFKSSDCTGELISTKTELGIYGLPEVDVEGTIPIDAKIQKAMGKIVGTDWFKIDNKIDRAVASCGILNWQRGVERELPSGKSCFTSGAIEPRFQVVGEEIHVCGDVDKDIKVRPKDCSSVMIRFKRPPKR